MTRNGGGRLIHGIAGLLALLWPLAGMSDGLGRLFTTPEERRLLDQARRGEAETAPAAAASAGPAKLTFNGYLLRSQGRPEIWINGAPVADAEQARQLGVGQMPTAAGLPVLLQPAPAATPAARAYELPEPLRRALEATPESLRQTLGHASESQRALPPGLAHLKPGQTLDRDTGSITENYLLPAPAPTPKPGS